ncbi:hydroxymethylbilane synthase [Ancylobacter terrae]|uniref:hydroxymethylbilane synthase n=1 Tax=Ancylobacter sp. sgz301288 TaxID=3342077 RepID=UPI00385A7200
MSKVFRIGTRASKMALAQSEAVRAALQAAFPEHRFELVTRPAPADRDHKSRLGALGGKGGAFIQAMRDMMTAGEADMAMHSLKDLPGNDEYYAETGFAIGACLPRDDARDALVLRESVTAPAVIGTSSIRRRAFLRRLFPDAEVVAFRGSADLRLDRLDRGTPMEFNYGGSTPPVEAVVLAKAGLQRIDLGHRISRVLEVEEMCPAVGQGVVIVEYQSGNDEIGRLLAAINHRATTFLYQAERAMLRELNGHCDSSIGGYATIEGGRLHLRGVVVSADGRSLVEVIDSTPNAAPADLGARVGERLNALGAQTIIEESRYID